MPSTIKLGSPPPGTADEVSQWQGLLSDAGFVVPVTGQFDAATDAATRAWQKAKGLVVDGIVGKNSWGAMLGTAPPISATPGGPVATDIAAVPGLLENTDNAFRYALALMASRLLTNPDYIVAAMAVETGKTFSASAENPLSHAIGLIQFMPQQSAATVTGLGKGTGPGSGYEFLKSLTPIEQLPYVEKYFKPFTGKMQNPNDAYLAVFWPAAMGKPADYVIAIEGTKVYEQNKLFDTAKKGTITAGDVGKAATNMLAAAAKKPRIPITPEEFPDGGEPVEPGLPGALAVVPVGGLLGLAAVAAYFVWRWWTGR